MKLKFSNNDEISVITINGGPKYIDYELKEVIRIEIDPSFFTMDSIRTLFSNEDLLKDLHVISDDGTDCKIGSFSKVYSITSDNRTIIKDSPENESESIKVYNVELIADKDYTPEEEEAIYNFHRKQVNYGGITSNIDEDQRASIGVYVNVNGLWRSASISPEVNGKWKDTDTYEITEDKIIGFRIVYQCDHDARHEDLPDLRHSPNIPAYLSLTGDVNGEMNMEYKGVVLEFDNKKESDQLNNEEEGILKYECSIYAVLYNDVIIDVTRTVDLLNWNDFYMVPNVGKVWISDKLNDLNIKIHGDTSYNVYGLHMEGWNTFFSTINHIADLNTEHNNDSFHNKIDEETCLLPLNERDGMFSNIAEIGIARDLHTQGKNMNGTKGDISQNIYWISVNDVRKPFIIEIYD